MQNNHKTQKTDINIDRNVKYKRQQNLKKKKTIQININKIIY